MSSDHRLSVDVLGPLRARDAAGRDVTPVGILQRRLLALLVLRRGRVVSADTAIDVLWPGRPPREPAAALHNHLFRLRRGLPEGVIESAGNGYRIPP
jgi:DNA-binding SARP family transcriptional activator